jgi:tetratricopeptide (TPR) repeat protein
MRSRDSATSAIVIAAVLAHGSTAIASPMFDAALLRRSESPPQRVPTGLRPAETDELASADAARREAAAAFADGEAAFERGEYSIAAGRFERAHRLSPHAWTLYNLALSRARSGDALGAWQSFDELATRARTDDERREAERERDALLPLLGVVVVRGDVGARACLDGEAIVVDRGGSVRRLVRPGTHRIETRERDSGIEIEAGETVEIRGASPATPRDRVRPWLAVGIAAGTIATGAATGGAVTADGRTAQALAGSAAAAGAVATTAIVVALVRRARERKATSAPLQCAAQNLPAIDTPAP